MSGAPYYSDDSVTLYLGDCLDVMRAMPDASVDSIVTDPPYGLGFMGKGWDDLPPGLPWAIECLRVLKPGGYLLAFGGSRTWHRLACAVEDAGFEMRDSIAWLYGSGFPKSLDVSKAIDRSAGAEREVIGKTGPGRDLTRNGRTGDEAIRPVYAANICVDITAPATPDAARWQGWGTALKPAFEPIVMGRKPLVGTVAANVLAFGTGALNVDGCRVEGHEDTARPQGRDIRGGNWSGDGGRSNLTTGGGTGRWPTNVILDDTQAAELDRQTGVSRDGIAVNRNADPAGRKPSSVYGTYLNGSIEDQGYGGSGGASRFFPTFHYEAKAPTSERPRDGEVAHPTVKPLDLMRWLVRLVTPPGGTVLEPFAGSGTTAEACVIEGFKCIAIEREATYLPLIVNRLSKPIAVTFDLGSVA